MKHTRETMSPTEVTSSRVDDGVIIGMPCFWAMAPAAIDRLEAISPSSATTLSSVMSRVTACSASCCLPWVS